MDFIIFYFFSSSLNIYPLIMIYSVAIIHLKNITTLGEKSDTLNSYNLKELPFNQMIYFLVKVSICCFWTMNFTIWDCFFLPQWTTSMSF